MQTIARLTRRGPVQTGVHADRPPCAGPRSSATQLPMDILRIELSVCAAMRSNNHVLAIYAVTCVVTLLMRRLTDRAAVQAHPRAASGARDGP